jgi:hypothetical protein
MRPSTSRSDIGFSIPRTASPVLAAAPLCGSVHPFGIVDNYNSGMAEGCRRRRETAPFPAVRDGASGAGPEFPSAGTR